MRVIVAYATLYPETKAALEADGYSPEYVDVGRSESAYHDLLASVWRTGRGFVNVEQDIVPWPGALARLIECPELWCGFAYSLSTGYNSTLGCARFQEALVHGHPTVFQEMDQLPLHGEAPRKWSRVDIRLKEILEDRHGLKMHIHWPAVGHLNPAQQPPFYNHTCGAPLPDAAVRNGPPYHCESCGSTGGLSGTI